MTIDRGLSFGDDSAAVNAAGDNVPVDLAALLQHMSNLMGDDAPDPAELLAKLGEMDDDAKSGLQQLLGQFQQLQQQADSMQSQRTQTWSALQPVLETLLAAGLVEQRRLDSGVTSHGETSDGGSAAVFAIHPGVAETGRRAAGDAVQTGEIGPFDGLCGDFGGVCFASGFSGARD